MSGQEALRQLPSVDRLLQAPAGAALQKQYGRDLLLTAIREALATARDQLRNGRRGAPTDDELLDEARDWLDLLLYPTLRPVINASGVIVHTNLGRAPLAADVVEAISAVARGYATLEFDVDSGRRGSRAVHARSLLQQITGAESALAVNNAAAAVLLMLTALCQGKEVIISRGQLIEIGGGFRVPDVMAQSGARLVEVGTTNRTHLRDYAAAITPDTGAILVAHASNFKIVGFTTEPSLAELADLAHAHGLPLLYDQGSGALLDTGRYGLAPETTVQEALAAGCDLVAFSGDKLLGGPQAGLLVGGQRLVEIARRHPLARAVRADKLCLAGLAATLVHYLKRDAETTLPVWQMMARSHGDLAAQAARWAEALRHEGLAVETLDGESTVGGGSLPGQALPTRLLAVAGLAAGQLAAGLRHRPVPVVGRVQDERLLLDPRTVLPHQEAQLLEAMAAVARAA